MPLALGILTVAACLSQAEVALAAPTPAPPPTATPATPAPPAAAPGASPPAAYPRIALLSVGETSPESEAARAQIAMVLNATGATTKEVTTGAGLIIEEPNAAQFGQLCRLEQVDLVGIVRKSPVKGQHQLDLRDCWGRPAVSPQAPRVATPTLQDRRPSLRMVGNSLEVDGTPLPKSAAFYELMGEPGLAEKYRSHERTKKVFQVLGGAVLIGGATWGILDVLGQALVRVFLFVPCVALSGTGSSGDGPRKAESGCGPIEPNPIPWMLAIGGGGVLIVASVAEADPLSDRERGDLARRYIDRTQRAQQPPGGTTQEVPGTPRASVSLAPVALPGGGGLMLRARF